jgi:pantothenate kinase type III
MRIGVIDVGNTRTHRGLFEGGQIRPLRGPVDLWIGSAVGKGPLPRGTLVLGRDFPPLVRNRARHPETVGADRLAQASAAWSRAKGPALVVSLGTAITIDLVNGRGEFVGGLIAPGLRTMARALHAYTAKLPLIEPERMRRSVGRDTREAIACGISWAAEGLIRQVAKQHRGRIFGTGGDAPLFRDLFDEWAPTLGLEGIARSYACWPRS